MYCELSSAYSGFRPVQLTENQEKHNLLVPGPPVLPPVLPPGPQASRYSDDISDRRLLLALAGLVVILLFVVLLLVVQ